ncbi:hypothetical protein AGLY_008141 [Aphis glycines]|uniref:Uncharacterized protein n=1 Tax=Aphis glycines TaxID=307491 RepID=A0A6G0TL28_APHGL|nr:hypothetical protein AGLY_008141 [Aphis glycines]
MYRITQKIILLWNMKSKIYVVIQKTSHRVDEFQKELHTLPKCDLNYKQKFSTIIKWVYHSNKQSHGNSTIIFELLYLMNNANVLNSQIQEIILLCFVKCLYNLEMCCKIYFKTVLKMLANSRHKRYNDFNHTPYHIYMVILDTYTKIITIMKGKLMSTLLISKLVVDTSYIIYLVRKKKINAKSTTMDMNLYNISLKINNLNTS